MNSIFFRNSKLRSVFNFWAQIAKTTNRLCRSWQRSNFRAASTCGRSSATPTIRAKVTPTSFFRGKLLLRSNFRSLSLPRLMRFLFLLHSFAKRRLEVNSVTQKDDHLGIEPPIFIIGIFLCRSDSTMILQTGQEINELDQSGFYTNGPTIFTGNLGSSKYIVQVRLKTFFTLQVFYRRCRWLLLCCWSFLRLWLALTSKSSCN